MTGEKALPDREKLPRFGEQLRHQKIRNQVLRETARYVGAMEYVQAIAADVIQSLQPKVPHRFPHEHRIVNAGDVRKPALRPYLFLEDVRKSVTQMVILERLVVLLGEHHHTRRWSGPTPVRSKLDLQVPKSEGLEERVIQKKAVEFDDIRFLFLHRGKHRREIIRPVVIVVVPKGDYVAFCSLDQMVSLIAGRAFCGRMLVDHARVGQTLHELGRSRAVVEHKPFEIRNVLGKDEFGGEGKKFMPVKSRRDETDQR